MFIDSHCHLDFPDFQARMPEVLANMVNAKVSHALCVSVDLPDFPKVRQLAEDHAHLYASVGVHPDYEDTVEPTVDDLVSRSSHPRVVAIGETGLDYFRLQGDLDWQRERFRVHIRAARQCGLPLIIHTRASPQDTLDIMREEGAEQVGGVMHCFTESWEVAQAAMEMGFYISFSGIVTFKNAVSLHEVAQRMPLDRILIETDAPYLAPVPFRGKLNDPSKVIHVAEKIAALRQSEVRDIEEASTYNFFNLFNKIKN